MKYIAYIKDTGAVLKVADTYNYVFDIGTVTVGESTFSDAGTAVALDGTEAVLPDPLTDINMIPAEQRTNLLPYLRDAELVKRAAQVEIREQAAATIKGIAASLGVTDLPVSWTQVNAKVALMMQSPDPAIIMQALALSAQLQSSYLFFKDNGGDPWNVR